MVELSKYNDHMVIGVEEFVEIIDIDNQNKKKFLARVDTGATKSSIDFIVASDLKLGPIVRSSKIKNAHGYSIRPVVKALLKIGDKEMEVEFNLANRAHMKYKVLLGQDILKSGFLIDPNIKTTKSK